MNKNKRDIKTHLIALLEDESINLMHLYDKMNKNYDYKIIIYNKIKFYIIDNNYEELEYILKK